MYIANCMFRYIVYIIMVVLILGDSRVTTTVTSSSKSVCDHVLRDIRHIR